MCNYSEDIYGDVGRMIKKFDIYTCDLGEPNGTSGDMIGKVRPCVILSSDNINDPLQSYYKVAPIRTEHGIQATSENAEKICEERKRQGHLLIPINMSTNEENIRFIDMTKICHISSRKVQKYLFSIRRERLKNRINKTLAYMFFNKFELEEVLKDFDDTKMKRYGYEEMKFSVARIEEDIEVPEIVEVDEFEDAHSDSVTKIDNTEEIKIKEPNSSELELEFSDKFCSLYPYVKRGAVSTKSAAARLSMSENRFNKLIEKYEAHVASITPAPEEDKQEENKSEENNNIVVVKPIEVNLGNAKKKSNKIPTGFSLYYKQYKEGKASVSSIAKKLGKTTSTIYNYINRYESMHSELVSSK